MKSITIILCCKDLRLLKIFIKNTYIPAENSLVLSSHNKNSKLSNKDFKEKKENN